MGLNAGGNMPAEAAVVEIVKVEVAADPAGVSGLGVKEQVAPAGSPEQARETAVLKPFRVTLRV